MINIINIICVKVFLIPPCPSYASNDKSLCAGRCLRVEPLTHFPPWGALWHRVYRLACWIVNRGVRDSNLYLGRDLVWDFYFMCMS